MSVMPLNQENFSVRALEALHISEPKEGMTLKLSAELATGQREEIDFTLCGWFREYENPGITLPVGYTSEVQVHVSMPTFSCGC